MLVPECKTERERERDGGKEGVKEEEGERDDFNDSAVQNFKQE